MWGQKTGGYCMTKRQINKVKGYQLSYFSDGTWPTSLGFFKTLKEAKLAAKLHKEKILVESWEKIFKNS